MNREVHPHNVFWTGGLDSTAHLLHMLHCGGEPVQPHYIIRSEESTGNEINAMNNIRRALRSSFPDLQSKLLPTLYQNEYLISRSEAIAREIRELKQKVKVHEQLHIMADYCKDAGIEHIDITYERDANLKPGDLKVSQFFRVVQAFESFHNVAAKQTKKESYFQAREEGWEELMKLTNFCRRPRRNGKPCGTCGPCCDAVKEGLGFRLPFSSRIKARILIPFRQFYRRNYLRQDSHWLFKMLKRRLEHRL